MAKLYDVQLGKATDDLAQYTVQGVQLTKLTPEELTDWIARTENKVAQLRDAQRAEQGIKSHKRFLTSTFRI